MIDKRFPNWDVDVEKGTIYSLYSKKYIGSVSKGGYLSVKSTNKKYKHKGVHQYIWMVANQADIPEGYDVHHIDGNPSNNSIYNLELVDSFIHNSEHKKGKHHSEESKKKMSEHKKGNQYRLGKNHSKESKKKMSKAQTNNPSKSKQVVQYTLDDELVKVWESARECGRNGFNQGNVSACCRGELKKYKGFIWKYYNEEKDVA